MTRISVLWRDDPGVDAAAIDMPKVLIVAYYFPPLGGMGSMRVAGFAEHLPAYGWEPTVLTPRSGAYLRDPKFEFPEDRVVRTGSLELSRLAKRALRAGGDDVRPAEVGTVGTRLQTLARKYVYYPDAQIGWYPPAVMTGRQLMRKVRFDVVISSSAPITAHLIARRLSRAHGIPWVADFRDPWSALMAPGTGSQLRAARLERSLATTASRVTMTSPSWAALHARRWGRRVDVIPNGYTTSAGEAGILHAGEVPASPDRFVIGYLGTFYPERQNLSALWDAIGQLGPADSQPVDVIRFIGNEPPGVRSHLEQRGLADLLEVTGYMSYPDAIDCLKRSSVLVVAGPADASGIRRGEIAGKVFEYLATKLPIIYIGDLSADAAALLRGRPGCHVVAGNDVGGVLAALRSSRGAAHERYVQDLSRFALTGRLVGLLGQAREHQPAAVA